MVHLEDSTESLAIKLGLYLLLFSRSLCCAPPPSRYQVKCSGLVTSLGPGQSLTFLSSMPPRLGFECKSQRGQRNFDSLKVCGENLHRVGWEVSVRSPREGDPYLNDVKLHWHTGTATSSDSGQPISVQVPRHSYHQCWTANGGNPKLKVRAKRCQRWL